MTAPNNKKKTVKAPSTQRYLPISEIHDDAILMKDGTLRQVVLVSSINFDLKTEDEQKAIIQGYIQLLNSLDFPIQIIVQSRKLNIQDYLSRLKSHEIEQQNELMKLQISEYRQYVSELVEIADIMSKRFFVVIPYSSEKSESQSFWKRLKIAVRPEQITHISEKQLIQYKEELIRRVELVCGGLESIGLKTHLLDTEALIELFIESYNPRSASNEQLTDMTRFHIDAE